MIDKRLNEEPLHWKSEKKEAADYAVSPYNEVKSKSLPSVRRSQYTSVDYCDINRAPGHEQSQIDRRQ